MKKLKIIGIVAAIGGMLCSLIADKVNAQVEHAEMVEEIENQLKMRGL